MGDQTKVAAAVVPERMDALLARARQEIDAGLLPACQVAVALDDEVVVDATFGLPDTTRFVPFSCSKVLTAASMWRLIGDGTLDVSLPVVEYVPAFDTN